MRAPAVLLLGLALAAGPAGAGDPHLDYMLECQGCHRADGSGSPGAVPDLRGSLERLLSAPGGRDFVVRVPGSATSRLSDAALAGVLNWMVRRFAPALTGFQPYAAAEVGRLRADPLVDVEGRRAELLSAAGVY